MIESLANFKASCAAIPPGQITLDEGRLQISGRVYLELSHANIEEFHSLLVSNKSLQSMCRVGNTFQQAIWNNEEVPEFQWESEDLKRVSRLPITKLTPLMEEFPVIEKNERDAKKYDRPKPDCWTWDWPKNPGWIPPFRSSM